MKGIGISVYPGQASPDANLAYVETAAKCGFTRVFTCLISPEGKTADEAGRELRRLTACAGKHGMLVIADIAPAVMRRLGVDFSDLAFFRDIGLDGVRLDLGFSGIEESIMSFNRYGLKIELNMSGGSKYLDNIMSYKPNTANILGCHNFYPHIYTGLSYPHFLECSRQFKAHGIRTAAFVNSPSASFGPWPVSEGLCTLELHRALPLAVQAKHLFATAVIDDVIIANAFASEDELRLLGGLERDVVEFTAELVAGLPALERKIVLEELHFNRGDVSDYMLRSTQSRVKYKGCDFPPFNTPDIQRGDILIDSSLYNRYAGELQVALKAMPNSDRKSVV